MADRTPQQSGNRYEQPDRPERVPQPGGENRGEEKEYPNSRSGEQAPGREEIQKPNPGSNVDRGGEQRDAEEGRESWRPEEQPNVDDAL